MRCLRLAAIALLFCARLAADTIALGAAINVREAEHELARPVIDRSTANQPLRIGGKVFEKGVGVQLNTTLFLNVNGAARFTAAVGVDDATEEGGATAQFAIEADEAVLWRSEPLRKGQAPVVVEIDLRGKKELRLHATDTGHAMSRAHVAWVNASFDFSGIAPKSRPPVVFAEEAVILTPKPKPEPRINSARVFGVRPGNPFLFTIAATGERPMTFSAAGLPPGLTLDPATGRITGKLAQAGTHLVTLRAKNARGIGEQKFRIEVGETIALTPPMGWNSWNCFGPEVSGDKVLRAAKAMVATGLIDHGWTYINIDDAWQGPQRGGAFNAIQPNEKFPDLPGLVAQIHALGLKAGIYSTPWETSYAGFIGGSADNPEGTWSTALITDGGRGRRRHEGKFPFAENDAKQWAAWGIDYLKYDWNPKSSQPQETRAEFTHYVGTMTRALRGAGRDMVYSYSNSMPFEWIEDESKLLNAWRTTGDIHDAWGFIVRIGFSQNRWRAHASPGHWNDPDMLVVGQVSVGSGKDLKPTKLTPNEQYTHLTLWSLLSAPLLIGCDMEKLDAFTLGLLSNDEVLEVNQDPRGEQAQQMIKDGRREAWVKELEDGSFAVGLFNLNAEPDEIAIAWAKISPRFERNAPARVRDLWRQQDVTIAPEKLSATIARHGAALFRVWPRK